MIRDTMGKIEKKVRESQAITEDNKKEYLELLGTLEQEVRLLSEEKKEEAEAITGFAGLSVQEAAREKPDSRLLKISSEGLAASVEEFEVSNPNLVAAVNSFCSLLANLGI